MTTKTKIPPAALPAALAPVAEALRNGDTTAAYAAARASGIHYARAMAAVDARVDGQPLDAALGLLTTGDAFPPVPIDLARAGWDWEPSPTGTARLTLATDGLRTKLYPPTAAAAGAFGEARAILAQEAAVVAEALPATAWQPGPDAQGVYRRPPDLDERIRVSPEALADGRWQPRESYDAEALDELTDSIRAHGVLEDLIALVNEAGQLELITGHRRKRAALAAGGQDVPVRIVEVTLAQAYEIAVISNDQRADLTDLERGRAYERMIAEQGISEAELARRLGRARAYIQQRRMLAQACDKLQAAVSAGTLGFTHARAICLGSGGDHQVQQEVTSYALKEIKAGRPDRAEDLQHRAERTVREQAAQVLKNLGWSYQQFWHGSTSLHLWFAPTARPVQWSSAEILAAAREQRRPRARGAPSPLTPEARSDLERVGWKFHQHCHPWIIAEKGKEFVIGDATDLTTAIAAAQTELRKLAERFAAAGWEASWKGCTLRATPPAEPAEGKKKPKKATPAEASNLTEAKKLISAIEDGTWTPEKKLSPSSYDYRIECAGCGAKVSDYRYMENGRFCTTCAAKVEADQAALKVTLAGYVDAHLGAWLDSAPDVGAALVLLHRNHNGVESVQRALADPAQKAAQLRAAFTDYLWRNRQYFKLSDVEAPATAVAAPPTAPEPGAETGAPADEPHHILDEDALAILCASGAPPTFGQILAAVATIEHYWSTRSPTHADERALEVLGEALEHLADDETIDDIAYEEAQHQIGQLLARLDEAAEAAREAA